MGTIIGVVVTIVMLAIVTLGGSDGWHKQDNED